MQAGVQKTNVQTNVRLIEDPEVKMFRLLGP